MFRPERFVDALLSLRPGLDPRIDFTVVNDGTGPVIASWNRSDVAQPSQQEITAVDTDALLNVPQSVTPRQARLMLNNAGLLDTVNSQINQIGGASLITWEYASEIRRDDPLIKQIGTALGLTNAQIDAMFVQAASL